MIPESNPTVKHELRDINVRALTIIMLSMIVASVLILLLIRGVYRLNEDSIDPAAKQSVYWSKTDVPTLPLPHLEIDLAGSLLESRQAQQKRLTTYGWVDKASGIVHVPIDQAIHQIINKGLPDWQKLEKPPAKTEAQEKDDVKADTKKEQKP